jgi:imidazole glycerol phosphate synthase subunit HisF
MNTQTTTNGITVVRATLKNIEEIAANEVAFLGLTADDEGEPMMVVLTTKAQEWRFPLMQGFQIHICNTFLRSLNCDVDVNFENFPQYSELIDECKKQLFKRYGDVLIES